MRVANLDFSQRAAVEIDPGERQIIVAGPGSGKTEVVAALVAHLLRVEGLDPAFELLVISYSRAAIHAMNRRLRAADVQSAASIRTLDSLAQQIVLEAYGEEISGRGMFDARVSRATEAVRSSAWAGIEEVEHLVVDEVQDVVGQRAELLLALVESLPPRSGFTLLGDPAQAIYDYLLSTTHPMTSRQLLDLIGKRSGVARRELTGSYRATTRQTRAAVALRHGAGQGLELGADAVHDFVTDLTPITDEEIARLAAAQRSSFAVLTDTNGQALMEVQRLWRAGIPALIRRRATSSVIDRWVAELLVERAVWTFDDFAEVVSDADVATDRWRALRRRDGPRTIETRDLALRLRRRALPAELIASDPDVPVVSTIHRAKGLEFDSVVLARYPARYDDDRDSAQIARVEYVGLTRAQSRLNSIERDSYPHILHRDRSDDRWLRSWKKKSAVKALEIRGEDVDRTVPPADEDASVVQHHLSSAVRPGDPLVLEYDWTSADVPHWLVKHDGVTVGRTTLEFGTAARQVLHGKIEMNLKDVHVECVETVVGEPVDGLPGRVGRHGLWLGVRPVGLACREWQETQ